jgi:hypothetical protein
MTGQELRDQIDRGHHFRALRPARATPQTVARAVASLFVVLAGYVAARSLPYLL